MDSTLVVVLLVVVVLLPSLLCLPCEGGGGALPFLIFSDELGGRGSNSSMNNIDGGVVGLIGIPRCWCLLLPQFCVLTLRTGSECFSVLDQLCYGVWERGRVPSKCRVGLHRVVFECMIRVPRSTAHGMIS